MYKLSINYLIFKKFLFNNNFFLFNFLDCKYFFNLNFISLNININNSNFKYYFYSRKNIFFLTNNQIKNKVNLNEKLSLNLVKNSLKWFKFNLIFIQKYISKLIENKNSNFFILNLIHKNYIFFFYLFNFSNLFLNLFRNFFFIWNPRISHQNFFKKKKSIKRKLKKNFVYNYKSF